MVPRYAPWRPRIRRLREQAGARGLAVRARESRDLQIGGRLAEETVREIAHAPAKIRDRLQGNMGGQRRRFESRRGLPQHRDGAALNCQRRVRESVRRAPLAGDEGRAERGLAAVLRQVGHPDVSQRVHDAVEQCREGRFVHRRAVACGHGVHASG
jgi:hypothetical protein